MKHLLLLTITFLVFSCQEKADKLPEEFDFGKVKNGLYKNDFFGLTIKFNPDWVVQDQKQMNELNEMGGDLLAGDDENLKSVIKASKVNTADLLTIFKHEVGAAVESNPSFIVVAENTSQFPGVKTGKDYLFHIKNLLKKSQLTYTFEKDVSQKKIGDSDFDILKGFIQVGDQQITQEYYSTVINGFSLSFIASYVSESEKEELANVIDSIKMQ